MPQKKPFVTLAQARAIAAEIPTPFHLYDEAGIRENARKVNAAFSWNKGFKEYFAVKATPNPYILKILQEEGCGVDCSSYTELLMGEACGFTGSDIMFSSNETPAQDMQKAYELGAYINLDDLTMWTSSKKRPVSPRPFAAATIRAVCLSWATASWITPATPSTA